MDSVVATPGHKRGTRVELELAAAGKPRRLVRAENARLRATLAGDAVRVRPAHAWSGDAVDTWRCARLLSGARARRPLRRGRVTTRISSASKRASASWIAISGSESPASAATVMPGVSVGEALGGALRHVVGVVLVVGEPLQPRLPHLRERPPS